MNKQKMALAIACGVGILAVFLPWISHPLWGNRNGLSIPGLENIGWVTVFLFAFSLLGLSKGEGSKKLQEKLGKEKAQKIASIIFGLFSIICGLFNLVVVFIVQAEIKLGQASSWGIGYYLTAISAIAVIVTSILRIKGDKK